ncbi:hypothetical protein [Paeniglutamicibacter sp.]|uniref:hypothetical protein n=1 Tax=Paeniglutamicibacter sp. TaxID=1934391 RepID=UPI003989B88C
MTAEAQPLADLVQIQITTSAVHAERIVEEVIDELRAYAIQLQGTQSVSTKNEAFGTAVYINEQIRRTLDAAVTAKQLLESFTPQGEEEHEND